MKYGMLGEGNFVDAETNNAPYDLLLDQQTDGQSLDSSLHPVTNSDIYPTAGDVSKNASYAEVDPDFKRSDTSWSSSVSPSYTKSDNDTQLLWFDSSDPSITPSTHITLGKNILVWFDNSQTTDVSSYSSPTSTDPVVQSSIDQIVSHTSQIPQNSDTALSPISSALFCETGVQEPDTTDVELLSGLVHLANIRQNIINASVETQHALEKKGLWGVVNQILQDDYPDKHINDTTLYDAVYGGQIGIEDAAPHKQAYGQDIDRRPSFDYESKQEAIAQAAQSELAKRISDLLWWWGSYEQEAASCKKQFAEKFEICKWKINFKTIQVCIETELLILQKCVKNAMCTNLFSVWDYLWATICRVSKWRDKATTKSEVSSVQEIVQSIQWPLIFLKNSGKILPHKMKREFLDVTLNLKLSDLLSFQIWHNSKLVAPFGDHNRKTKLQEQKNKDRFESITKAVSQERLADKDKYSQAYNDIQWLSQTPLLTSQGVTYSQQIGDDIAFRYYGISHNQLITNTKLKHRTDILDLYDNHRKRTQAMRDTIALDTKKQADIAQTAARADQEGM